MRQRSGAGEATDAELAQRAGAGDLAAFEELYRRHVGAAWRVAVAVSGNPHDAADAVSDAFTKVFQALPGRLRDGEYFLPYLLASVRNSAIDVLRRGSRQPVPGSNEELDGPTLTAEPAESVVADVDSALVARAFLSLPERWRSVLWLTEVEGIPAREVAGMLGVSANGVAQLAVRARAGLRQRFLQAHVGDADVRNGCRYTVAHLGAYVAGGLAPRDIAKVDQHLAGCETCRARRSDLEDLAPTLRRAVLPLPAGLAALAVSRWRLTSTGATAAKAAAPAGFGVGTAVVAVPAPFVASVASVALFVAGIVGVGVVEHRNGRPAHPADSPVVIAPAAEASFVPASAPGGEAGADDPVVGLTDEHVGGATELDALAAAAAPFPTPAAPQVPSAPGPDQLLPLLPTDLGIELIDVAGALDAATGGCPAFRLAGATLDCEVPTPRPGAPDDAAAVGDATGLAVDAVTGTGITRAPTG